MDTAPGQCILLPEILYSAQPLATVLPLIQPTSIYVAMEA